MMDSTIYIPTYRRVNSQITVESLRETEWWGSDRVKLVCPEDEADLLSGMGLPAVSCPAIGIGPTRQWILDNHDYDRLGRYVFMMDDDLKFFERRFDDPGKFRPIGNAEVVLRRLRAMLDQVPLAGLANRSGANRLEVPVKMNGRMHDLQCMDLSVIHRHGIRFDRIRFMEDFDVTLQLLTRGYPTALLTTHCKDDVGSNAAGGCSVYRDQDGQSQAAHMLHQTFPDIVTVVRKEAKGDGMWSHRDDVRVQWAKAFKAGVELRDILGEDPYPTPDWTELAPEWEIF